MSMLAAMIAFSCRVASAATFGAVGAPGQDGETPVPVPVPPPVVEFQFGEGVVIQGGSGGVFGGHAGAGGSGPLLTPEDVDREVKRLKQRLSLTDEQEAKAREILKGEAEARKSSRDKLREVLSDEQKTKFDQAAAAAAAGGGAMRGFEGAAREALQRLGESGQFARTFSTGKSLQAALGLTDEQIAKIDEAAKELAASGGPQTFALDGNGRPDMDAIRKRQEEQHKALGERIRALLTDEQKSRFDEVWAKRSPSAQPGMMRFGGGAFGGSHADPTRLPPAERAKRVLEALQIAKADEAAAVRALIDQVCAAQKDLNDHNDRMTKRVRELARDTALSDDAVAKELETLREERRAVEKRVAASQRELREVVTYKQELALLEHGMLR